jgi:hypothetical protein
MGKPFAFSLSKAVTPSFLYLIFALIYKAISKKSLSHQWPVAQVIGIV